MKSISQVFNKKQKGLLSSTLILSMVLVFMSFSSFAQETGTNITVTVNNVKNDNGKVVFALHTKDTFMNGNGIMNVESDIKQGKVAITFENVKPGEYAVMVLHDENSNSRMDYRENGMPLESYGMSNNVMSFGPPVYDDAKFKVEKENLELNIRF